MAKLLALWAPALKAAKGGMSERAWERQMRAEGLGARSSEMLQLWRYAKTVSESYAREIGASQYEVPVPGPNEVWPVKKATGIAQTVTLTYRDRTTGTVMQTWWRTVTPEGITREQAVAEAIDAYSGQAVRYQQDLIGAIHTSAYRLMPFGE